MKKIFKIILIAVGIFFLISSCSKTETTAHAAEEVGETIQFSMAGGTSYESDTIYISDYQNNEITMTAAEANGSATNWNSLVKYLIVEIEGVLFESGYMETVTLVFSSSGQSQTAKFSEGLEMFSFKATRTVASSGISIKINWTADYNAIGAGTYEEGYEAGYEEGYDWGYDVGYQGGKWDGRAEGEEIGYNKGYSDALNSNLDAAGIWAATLALITTFFNLITTFFATKIAGDATIGFFVIGIPVTIWIIELIIDLVVGWIKGGKKSSGGDDDGGIEDK